VGWLFLFLKKKLGSGVPAMLLFRDDSAASDAVQRALYQTAAHFKGVLNVCAVNGARYQKLAGNTCQKVRFGGVVFRDKTLAG